MRFDTKLVHGSFEICLITGVCNKCTSMIDTSWSPGSTPHQQPRYQPITDCTYWPVLGSFNNCNIVQFSHKETYSEDIG